MTHTEVAMGSAVGAQTAAPPGPRLTNRTSRHSFAANGTRRVTIDAAAFRQGDQPFRFRGVTYGTFQLDELGEPYPTRHRVRKDFAAIRDNGFTVVRTYTVPPNYVLQAAADYDLQLLIDVFWNDWRYMVGTERRERRALEVDAEQAVRRTAQRLAGNDHVLGLCLGNEVPADVVRWIGRSAVSRFIRQLARSVREVDAERLVTYANYPTSEYLSLEELDFLTFNVFLDNPLDLSRYLTRLHHLAAGRPIVLGELGVECGADPDDELRQAELLDVQLKTVVERGIGGVCLFAWTDDWWVGGEQVEGWHFGLTRADRSSRPALEVARHWNGRRAADLDFPWPSMTVVVCAFNAAKTLDECLRHVCALDYPDLEILVVDDGSTDNTADIARRYKRVRLISIPHAGLSTARNEGYRAAIGEMVAYLDSDAYPSPEWPYYLALGMDGSRVGGVGGPNLPPTSDSWAAHSVARAPGGPAHVLFADDRAEHIPGCNMAFWRTLLVQLGGFDPVFTSAGDDVDFCWRVLEQGWEIGFHPAAFVWHHPRPSARSYLRQQLGYGRSEAQVEARHPDRFTRTGAARWHGSIYGPVRPYAPRLSRCRIYQGPYGSAAYQSVYRAGGHLLDLAHHLGVPAALLLIACAPLAAFSLYFGAVSGFGFVMLIALMVTDVFRCNIPSRLTRGRRIFRVRVALLHLVQPLARTAGRYSRRVPAPAGKGFRWALAGPAVWAGRTALLLPEDTTRSELVSGLVDEIRRAGIRVAPTSGWESYDALVRCSVLTNGRLVSSSHPPGWVQVRVRMGARWSFAVPFVIIAGVLVSVVPVVVGCLVAVAMAETWHGHRRLTRAVRHVLSGASS